MSIPGEGVSSGCGHGKFGHTLELADANGPRRRYTGIGKILDENTSHEVAVDETARRNPEDRRLEGPAIGLGEFVLHCDCGRRRCNAEITRNRPFDS